MSQHELIDTLSKQIDTFREDIDRVGNIRQTPDIRDVKKLFEDIDILQPLILPIAHLLQSDYITMNRAQNITTLIAYFEIEVVLLIEELDTSTRISRQRLNLQRGIERRGGDILSEIAALQGEVNSAKQKEGRKEGKGGR